MSTVSGLALALPGGLLAGASLLVVALLAALAALVWHVVDGVLLPAPYALQPEFEVLDFDSGSGAVRLPAPPARPRQFQRTDAAGRFGLMWQTPGGAIGHGLLGRVEARGEGWLERRLEVVVGPPPGAAAPARLDVTLYRRDPLADHGQPFEDVRIPGESGAVAAWWIDRAGPDAVVLVHGRRRGARNETLRALPTVLARDASVLVASYRNHDVSDASPSGLYTYGQEEADDLLAALAWLEERGVRRVVLVTYSMGSAVGLLARGRWPAESPELLGMVMDSPLIDPREVVRAGVRAANLPVPRLLADLALAVAARRALVDWAALDLRRWAPALDLPVLLIGGVLDGTAPIELLDDFASRVPAGGLTYWRVAGAEHVEAYNVDPDGYERRLGDFLDRVLAT